LEQRVPFGAAKGTQDKRGSNVHYGIGHHPQKSCMEEIKHPVHVPDHFFRAAIGCATLTPLLQLPFMETNERLLFL